MKNRPVIMWFIEGNWSGGRSFLYPSGGFFTRRATITAFIADVGGTWKQRYRRGDRAVKCRVTKV